MSCPIFSHKIRQQVCSLCVLVFCFSVTSAESEQLQSTQDLVKTIHKGGYVLYMRHASTDHKQIDLHDDNFDDCSKQRNLSADGRAQAREIGEAIRKLNIPIGSVITSPYCRCVDTARLSFGRGEKTDDLQFTISTDKQKTQQLADALKLMLATPPSSGTNTVLVAHTANLKEASNVWPKPEGVLMVFKPLAEKGFEYMGRIGPDQWLALSLAK